MARGGEGGEPTRERGGGVGREKRSQSRDPMSRVRARSRVFHFP